MRHQIREEKALDLMYDQFFRFVIYCMHCLFSALSLMLSLLWHSNYPSKQLYYFYYCFPLLNQLRELGLSLHSLQSSAHHLSHYLFWRQSSASLKPHKSSIVGLIADMVETHYSFLRWPPQLAANALLTIICANDCFATNFDSQVVSIRTPLLQPFLHWIQKSDAIRYQRVGRICCAQSEPNQSQVMASSESICKCNPNVCAIGGLDVSPSPAPLLYDFSAFARFVDSVRYSRLSDVIHIWLHLTREPVLCSEANPEPNAKPNAT